MPARAKTPKRKSPEMTEARRRSGALSLLQTASTWELFLGDGGTWLWRIPSERPLKPTAGGKRRAGSGSYVVYPGKIDERGSCTCPDFMSMKAPGRCKHLLAARTYSRVARANLKHRKAAEAARRESR